MKYCCTLSSLLSCVISLAQVPVGPSFNNQIINFQQAYPPSHFYAYSGLGLSATEHPGALNSNTWKFTGLSDGNSEYAEQQLSGDFARGTSLGNESTGGIYAFEWNGQRYLGWQSTSTDLSPGIISLKLQNQDSINCILEAISFDVIVNNNEHRSSSLSISYRKNTLLQQLKPLCVLSPDTADSLSWSLQHISLDLPSIILPRDSSLEILFEIADFAGDGSRDEWGLNNIQISSSGILYHQSFESSHSDTWNVSKGVNGISTQLGQKDYPAFQRIASGIASWQAAPNKRDSLILDPLQTTFFEDLKLSFQLSATGDGGGGMDAADSCNIYLNELLLLSVQGKNDNSWSFYPDAPSYKENQIHPFPGSYQVLQNTGGGLRDLHNDAFSAFQIPILENLDSLAFSIVCISDKNNEHWNVDDISITGNFCHCPEAEITDIQHYYQGDTVVIRVQKNTNDSVLIMLSEDLIPQVPACGEIYAVHGNILHAPVFNQDSSVFSVAKGNDSLFYLTNLLPGTSYNLKAFAYSSPNCYHKIGYPYNFVACEGAGLASLADFDGNELPVGWKNSKTDTWYSSTGNSGTAIPAFKFDTHLQTLESNEQCERIGLVSLWFKGVSADSLSSFLISGKTKNGNWMALDSSYLFAQNSDAYARYILPIAAELDLYQLRITYRKSQGNLALDDLALYTTGTAKAYRWTASVNNEFNNPYNWSPPRFLPSVHDSIIITGNENSLLTTSAPISHLRFTSNASWRIESPNWSTLIFAPRISSELVMHPENQWEIGGNIPMQLIFFCEDSLKIDGTLKLSDSKAHQLFLQNSTLRFQSGSSFVQTSANSGYGNTFPFVVSGDRAQLIFAKQANFKLLGANSIVPNHLTWLQFEKGSNFMHSEPNNFSIQGNWCSNLILRGDKEIQLNSHTALDSLIAEQGLLMFSGGYNLSLGGNLHVKDSATIIFDSTQVGKLLFTGDSALIQVSPSLYCPWPVDIGGSYQLRGSLCVQHNMEVNGSLEFNESDSLFIEDSLIVRGELKLSNGANLLQGGSITNSGICEYRQKIGDPSQFGQYHFWSSPTQDSLAHIGPGRGLWGKNVYSYDPYPAPTGSYLPFQNPIIMQQAKAFVLSHTHEGIFSGTFNNGTISYPFEHNSNKAPYHLIGNPYPSSINTAAFLEENIDLISGTIYLWSQDGSYSEDASKHYIAINQAGSSSVTLRSQTSHNTQLSACQGFFVELKENLPAGHYQIQFKNEMRNASRQNLKSGKKEDLEQYWIYLENEKGDSLSCLLVRGSGFSGKFDHGFDSYALDGAAISIHYKNRLQQILAIDGESNIAPLPIVFGDLKPGSYKLGLLGTKHSGANNRPILLDTEEHKVIESAEESISFNLSNKDLIENRFFIALKRNQISTDLGEFHKIKSVPKNTYYRLLDLMGREIMSTKALEDIYRFIGLKPTHRIYILQEFDEDNKLLDTRKLIFK